MRLRFLIPTVFLGLACGGSSADDSLSAGATGGRSGASQAAGKGGGTAANACSELATCCASISNIQTKKSCEDTQKSLAMKPDLTSCMAFLAGYVGQGVCGAGQGAGGAVGAGGAAGSVSAAGTSAAGMGGSIFGGGGGLPMGQGGMPMGQGGFGMGEGGFPGQGGAAGVGPGGTSGGGFAGGPAGGVPKTCEEAHGVQGCCTADGKAGYYWESSVFGVTPFTCKAGEVCSWTPGQSLEGIYDCVVGTTPKVDPKGVFPYLCGLPKVEGTCQ